MQPCDTPEINTCRKVTARPTLGLSATGAKHARGTAPAAPGLP